MHTNWALKFVNCLHFLDYIFFRFWKRIKKAGSLEPAPFRNKTFSPVKGNNYILHTACSRNEITGFYSVVVLVTGQQPGTSSPAQHGLVQSGGQTFGQQPGVPSTAQQGLVGSSGQVFATDPHSAFCAHSPSAFAANKACEAGQHELAFA